MESAVRGLAIVVATILLVTGAYVAFRLSHPTFTHRYRLSVDVEVDGKIRSGSSVVEVSVQEESVPGRGRLLVPSVRGEAAFVDLGQGRNVVALLSFPARSGDMPPIEPYMLARLAFDPPPHMNDLESYRNLASMSGRTDLTGTLRPRIVSFPDPTDPMVVHQIDPARLHEQFGEGVRLARIGIELTDEKPKAQIEHRLPWMAHPERYRTIAGNPATWQPTIELEELKRGRVE